MLLGDLPFVKLRTQLLKLSNVVVSLLLPLVLAQLVLLLLLLVDVLSQALHVLDIARHSRILLPLLLPPDELLEVLNLNSLSIVQGLLLALQISVHVPEDSSRRP